MRKWIKNEKRLIAEIVFLLTIVFVSTLFSKFELTDLIGYTSVLIYSLSLFIKSPAIKKFQSTTLLALFLFGLTIYLAPDLNYPTIELRGTTLMLLFMIQALHEHRISQKKDIKNYPTIFSKKNNKIFFSVTIFLFLLLKALYFTTPFEAQKHSDKYSTFLPAAVNMSFEKSIFSNKNNAYIQPTNNHELLSPNVNRPFSSPPIFEWLTYPLLRIGLNPLIAIRLVTGSLGLLLIYLAHFLTKSIANETTAVIFSFFLATNPLFHLLTTIPTLDLPALCLTIGSLTLWHKNKHAEAYLLTGLAIMFKISFAAIAPVVFISDIIFNWRKKSTLLTQTPLMGIPLISFTLLVQNTPNVDSQIQRIIQLILFAILIGVMYSGFKKITIKNRKVIPILFAIIAPGIGFTAYKYAKNFLPSLDTLFSGNLYLSIFTDTINLLPLPIIAIIVTLTPLKWPRDVTKLTMTNFFMPLSIATYFIIASKAIFFHTYYKHVIIFFITGLSAYAIYRLMKTNIKKQHIIITLCIGITIIFYNKTESTLLSRTDTSSIEKIAHTLNNFEAENSIILRSDSTTKNISLYSKDLYILNYTSLGPQAKNRIRSEISNNGFRKFLDENNIKYLVSNKSSKDEMKLIYDNFLSTSEKNNRESIIEQSKKEPIKINDITQVNNIFTPIAHIDGFTLYETNTSK